MMPTQAPSVGILGGWEQVCWWKDLGEQPLPAPSSGRVPPAQSSPPGMGEQPPTPAPSQLFWTSPVPRGLCKAEDFLQPGGPQLRSHVCEMRGEAGCGRALTGPLPPGSSGAWGWGAELLSAPWPEILHPWAQGLLGSI